MGPPPRRGGRSPHDTERLIRRWRSSGYLRWQTARLPEPLGEQA